MRYQVFFVGTRVRYSREGGSSIDVSDPFADFYGGFRKLSDAIKAAFNVWRKEDLGSLSEHLIIMDMNKKRKNKNILFGANWKKILRLADKAGIDYI